jgi:hypothetical protein
LNLFPIYKISKQETDLLPVMEGKMKRTVRIPEITQ